MKEKYYVRLVSSVGELPGDFVFGLSYDGSTIVVGGPAVMKEKILETVCGVFGERFGTEHDHGRRFIAVANRVPGKRWHEGLAVLSEKFSVTPTRRFRRLMR